MIVHEYQLHELEDKINALLDECERTGVLKFRLPETESANRAIVALYDAVGRNP